LFVLLFIACGGDNGSGPGNGGNNTPPTPQPTAAGTPDGNPTSQTIGAAGGTVMSEDSLFTLTIPAGALASDTLITVQPITNTAWGGIGMGYRLTPHGLHFAAPVSLAFKVAPADLEGGAPSFLNVTVQDDEGLWYILKNRTYDNGTATITSTTNHFSDYAQMMAVQLQPSAPLLHTDQDLTLNVQFCSFVEYRGPDPYRVATLVSCDDSWINLLTISNWSVNGVTGGSAATGVVTDLGRGQARYKAPPSAPAQNPVAVSVQIESSGTKATLVSNISIGGDFTGDIVHTTGSGAVGEKAVWHMAWASNGAIDGIETFAGAGTLDYTPQTLPCTTHTFDPTSANVTLAYMVIDRRTEPYKVTVTTDATWSVHECNDCGGVFDCHDNPDFHVGFGDSNGTISADGNTISGHYHDDGSGEDWTYTFTQ
jgi:hypothetical protein